MIRNWTLVSVFAAMAVVSWGQAPAATPQGTRPDVVRQIERGTPPVNAQPQGLDPRQQQERDLPRERVQRASTPAAKDQLVRPGQTDGAPVQATERSPRPADRAQNPERTPEVSNPMPRGPENAPKSPSERVQQPEVPSKTGAREPVKTNGNTGVVGPRGGREGAAPSTPKVDSTPITRGTDTVRRATENQSDRENRAGRNRPSNAATPSTEKPSVTTPSADSTPASTTENDLPKPANKITPAAGMTPRAAGRPDAAETPSGARPRVTPDVTDTPVGAAETPTEAAKTPAEASETPKRTTPATPVATAPPDATPFVPTDMPERLRRKGQGTPPKSADETGTPKAGSTPITGEAPGRNESTETPAAGETPTAANKPGAVGTPPAGVGATPSTSPKPAASPSPTEALPTPGPAAAPTTEEGKKALEERKNSPTIQAGDVKQDDLNPAAAALLNQKPTGTPALKPADVKLTPWVAPEVVTNPQDAAKAGGKPVLVMPPPGATPTPTPAPDRIMVNDPATIINNVQDITIAPTPPPAPTPGVTPVPPPPGVTPPPRGFKPDRNWVPYPGWRPPTNWTPPRGWTPPGGWSPPPGWRAPKEWVPRLRQWGWNYIPRRGWVVPVQWAPPPDFVVPPDWYYLPSSAYDDYGLYDPSQVVVMSGHARPDLQININTTEVYMPPAPPPMQVLEAMPPPPRPAPPELPRVPQEITSVQTVAEVLSRPRNPNGPRYQGPVLVTGSVHFDYDKYAIKPESFPTLDAVGQALVSEMPDAILNVEGHTDSDGSDEYNQTLSEQRAWSVKSYLVQKFGLDPNRLIIVGYGERAPMTGNDTDQGKARNRRVEFENVTDLYKAQVVDTARPQ